MAMSKKTAERIERLKARAKSAGGKLMAGAKGSAVAMGAGVAVKEIEIHFLSDVEFLNEPDRWWAKPAAYAVAGHFLKRKYPTLGIALLGAAGYAGAEAYENHEATTSEGATRLGGAEAGASQNQIGDSVYGRRRDRAQMNGSGMGGGGGYGPVAEAGTPTPTYHDAGAAVDPWQSAG